MSIKWFDGFDDFGTATAGSPATAMAAIFEANGYLNANATLVSSSEARTGNCVGFSGVSNSSFGFIDKYLAEETSGIIGFAWKAVGELENASICQIIYNNGVDETIHFAVRHNTLNGIEVRRGNFADNAPESATLVAQSAGETIRYNTWHFITVEWATGDTAPFIKVSVDGEVVIDESGITVSSIGDSPTNVCRFRCTSNTGSLQLTHWYDDFYYVDPTDGLGEVASLGDIRVFSSRPDAAGDTTQFGVTGAASNWQAVDDVTPDNDTTYVSDDTVGQKDLYNVASFPAGIVDVYAVMTRALLKKSDAGSREFLLRMKLGGVDVADSSKPAPTSYAGYHYIRESKPAGGAWAPADLTSVQIGIEVN